MDSGLLFLLTWVAISYRTNQINIITSLNTKELFPQGLLHNNAFLEQAWIFLYCIYNDTKFQFDNIKCHLLRT